MRVVVVFRLELRQEVLQGLGIVPGVGGEPFQDTHKRSAMPLDCGWWRAMTTWRQLALVANC